MSGFTRRTLLILLCVLVVSWGACPCVYARMFERPVDEPEEVPATSCCCGHAEQDAPADDSVPEPGDCPCCSKGGALRDLPPHGDVDLLDTTPPVAEAVGAPDAVEFSAPVTALRAQPGGGTGPPLAPSPHACPVGIVLLLS